MIVQQAIDIIYMVYVIGAAAFMVFYVRKITKPKG